MDAYEFDNADQSAKFIEVGETQNRNLITAFNCKGDDKDIIKHKVSKDFNNFASSGRIGSLFFDITNTTSGKEFIKSVQIFNTNSAGVRTTQMSQAIVSKDQKHIEVPCAAVKQGDIILIEILRMDDREGDYTLSLSESPQPKVIPDATVCIGTTLQVVNLPGSASVDWLSSVYNLSNLTGQTTRILSAKANSGIVFTTIKDQGCTVTLKNFLVY